jgi:acetylxylan esterase
MRLLTLLTNYLSVAAAATLGKRAPTPGSLSQVTSFGEAPTKAGFYIYVPKKLAASPGVIVAIHYCTGSAQAYFNGSPYKTLSEQYGFIVIYPSSPHSGTCWDVSSKQTLSHDGKGDSNTIANMVKWTLTEYKGDATKVFVTGSSSGGMMTVRHTFQTDLQATLTQSLERHGRYLSRDVQGRHRLLWRWCRLLRI